MALTGVDAGDRREWFRARPAAANVAANVAAKLLQSGTASGTAPRVSQSFLGNLVAVQGLEPKEPTPESPEASNQEDENPQ
jgi:hypothetical protein